jgi:hypothetical protein
VLPGIAAMAFVYIAFARSGAAALESAIEDSLAGRAARVDDMEETQIGNIAHEMSIAAHLPPPRVLIGDTLIVRAWLRFSTALLLVGGLISGRMYGDLPPRDRPSTTRSGRRCGPCCGGRR